MVSGIRSPISSIRTMRKWPGLAALARAGASISQRKVEGPNCSRWAILYMVTEMLETGRSSLSAHVHRELLEPIAPGGLPRRLSHDVVETDDELRLAGRGGEGEDLRPGLAGGEARIGADARRRDEQGPVRQNFFPVRVGALAPVHALVRVKALAAAARRLEPQLDRAGGEARWSLVSCRIV